ncbi:hypothetical protein FQA39_LY14652 [Lamprigera yunnana]|nr:hypothetical protein FQA39_LY14652 [Lamprigera yunnana]
MVRAYYLEDPKENELKFVAMDTLYKISGVEYFKLNKDTYKTDGLLDSIKKERGYNYEDEFVCSKECMPNYQDVLKNFYTEHLHDDDEIRFVSEGSGYFDVRAINDEWIRIEAEPGDMIILPRGIYHRFTLDTNSFIRARRFFVGSPIWTAYYRPADDMECRKSYLQQMKLKSSAL